MFHIIPYSDLLRALIIVQPVQVQQVWIGKKSGLGSGVPWRYSDRNPFGLRAAKYPPLLSMNVHRFQM